MSERIVTTIRCACATDNLSPYFAGEVSLEDALQDSMETFLTCYNSGTFVCSLCGDIVYPKVTTNEHGIFISNTRSEVRGGLANKLLKQNVCDKCVENMIKIPESSLINRSLCDRCVHSEICRFEVPTDETCEHYMKG